VLVNACQIDLPGSHLGGHSSWAERFLHAGAAAVIVISWSVLSSSASRFAEELYRKLTLMDTDAPNLPMRLSEAVRRV